ncbi:MAG: hypothetical protein M9938_01155 [Solirubrobacterales bacterium]|nr:hypothetical protein [Solirubrobacterales bacterium]
MFPDIGSNAIDATVRVDGLWAGENLFQSELNPDGGPYTQVSAKAPPPFPPNKTIFPDVESKAIDAQDRAGGPLTEGKLVQSFPFQAQ